MQARIVSSDGHVIADRARWATSGPERRKGLIGAAPLEPGEGLILDRAYQVHTFRMSWPIDVLFCSRDWEVRHVIRSMVPGRMSKLVLRGRYAVELPAGSVPAGLGRGDRLVVKDVPD
jgi:uncharacterized membrane protein (UPF0127 family)